MWKSIAVWPDTISVGHEVGKNESSDTHNTKEQAEAVCGMLERMGFGGDRKVFPLSTRVEPVAQEALSKYECPACQDSEQIVERHHDGTTCGLPECDFKHCNGCGHQWGQN